MDFTTSKEEFSDFCDKWDKALQSGIFDDAPKPSTPSSQTAEPSFFGPLNTHPTDAPSDVDVKYWDAIYRASNHAGDTPDPLYAAEQLDSQLMRDHDRRLAGLPPLNEEHKKHREFPPNPVSIDTGGKDQDLSPESLGLTFDEEDIKSLEDLKHKLFELENKVATALGKGESDKSFQSQINNMKKRIDDLSTKMGYSYPTDLA